MLKIYHSQQARSLRVVWLAEEIGMPHEIVHMPFNPAALKAEDFLRINPFGAVPAIEDGGVRMTESGAICQYLTEKYGHAPFKKVLGDADYPAYLQWIHAGEATMTPPLGAVAQHTPEAGRLACRDGFCSSRPLGVRMASAWITCAHVFSCRPSPVARA